MQLVLFNKKFHLFERFLCLSRYLFEWVIASFIVECIYPCRSWPFGESISHLSQSHLSVGINWNVVGWLDWLIAPVHHRFICIQIGAGGEMGGGRGEQWSWAEQETLLTVSNIQCGRQDARVKLLILATRFCRLRASTVIFTSAQPVIIHTLSRRVPIGRVRVTLCSLSVRSTRCNPCPN